MTIDRKVSLNRCCLINNQVECFDSNVSILNKVVPPIPAGSLTSSGNDGDSSLIPTFCVFVSTEITVPPTPMFIPLSVW